MLAVAAAAMVGSLPGRTQGLGLVTEPLLADLGIDRVSYAALNFWATIIGSAGALGVGYAIDRAGSRVVLAAVLLALGAVVCFMSAARTYGELAVWITLTRALGQSALSVASLAIVGHWFVRRIDSAMAVYSVIISVGFMAAFPAVGAAVQAFGWRAAWLGIGVVTIALLAPLALLIVRRNPQSIGLLPDGDLDGGSGRSGSTPSRAAVKESAALAGYTWTEALSTPSFWVFAIGTALYGLVASGIGLFNESILAERGFGADVYYQTLAVTAMTALAGNFLGGWLSQRVALGRLEGAVRGERARHTEHGDRAVADLDRRRGYRDVAFVVELQFQLLGRHRRATQTFTVFPDGAAAVEQAGAGHPDRRPLDVEDAAGGGEGFTGDRAGVLRREQVERRVVQRIGHEQDRGSTVRRRRRECVGFHACLRGSERGERLTWAEPKRTAR